MRARSLYVGQNKTKKNRNKRTKGKKQTKNAKKSAKYVHAPDQGGYLHIYISRTHESARLAFV